MYANTYAPGTIAWTEDTLGLLTPDERRAMVRAIAVTHLRNIRGRLALALRLHPGRNMRVGRRWLEPPTTALTVAARAAAERLLTPSLLNHSERAYRFARILGEIEDIAVEDELLYAAALLHDTGLVTPEGRADFTLRSAAVARDVAAEVALPDDATDVVLTAITMHHTPGVGLAHGPEAYLLSAGAAVDVLGIRAWDLPDGALAEAVADYPREHFKRDFVSIWRDEAARVPQGRAHLLRRWAAFDLAVRFAPFPD